MGYGAAGAALAEKSTANASIQNASDPQEALRLAAEQRKNASAAKIEQMRTILTPAQLQQYAAMIQIRDQNYYAGLARGSNLPNR
jgi:DNA-binding MurR/RpiR family transcriptional regulator